MQPFRHKCHGTCEMRGAQLICIPLHPVSARLMWLPVRIPGTRGMMDVFAVLGGCMNRMFAGVEGMKILLVDHETVRGRGLRVFQVSAACGEQSGIISLVMSQSRLFELDVFLVDYLDNEHRQKQKNLVCVCLLRPTSENFEVLAAELSDPKYGSYHLCTTTRAAESLCSCPICPVCPVCLAHVAVIDSIIFSSLLFSPSLHQCRQTHAA